MTDQPLFESEPSERELMGLESEPTEQPESTDPPPKGSAPTPEPRPDAIPIDMSELAAEMDMAVYGITHFTKGTAGRDPVERITGSLAFGALTRLVTVAMKMPEDGDHPQGARLFARAKSNIGPDGGGFYYFLDVCEVPGHPGIFNTRVLWGAGVEGTAKELIAKAETLTPDDHKTGEAIDWLKEALGDGPRGAKDLITDARENGISRMTLQRAKDRLKVKSTKAGFAKGWWWVLPGQGGEDTTKIPIQPGVVSSGKKHTQPIDSTEDTTKVPHAKNLGVLVPSGGGEKPTKIPTHGIFENVAQPCGFSALQVTKIPTPTVLGSSRGDEILGKAPNDDLWEVEI